MLFQSCIFSHPVVNFSALVLEAYLINNMQSHALCSALSSFFALIKCAHAMFSHFGDIHGLSNRAIFNDLEQTKTHISRSGHSLTLNISEMAKDTAIVTIEGE